MRRLIYVSKAAIGIGLDHVDAIVTGSVARNTGVGVTGMLWFDGAHFAQVLEGEHAAVERTIERIRRDWRHHDIEIVLDRQIAHKMFQNWAMIHGDDSSSLTASNSFLVGYAGSLQTRAGRQLYETVLANA